MLTLNKKEELRAKVCASVVAGRCSVAEAATELGIGRRQMQRLLLLYRDRGPKGLRSRKRGVPSNRAYSEEFRARVMGLVSTFDPEAGPSRVSALLSEHHGLNLPAETVRVWMTEQGLWVPRKDRHPKPQSSQNNLEKVYVCERCGGTIVFRRQGKRGVVPIHI